MLESKIEKMVCDYAQRKYNILTRKYTSPSHRSVPDRLFIMPDGRVAFIEFKQAKGRLTAGQAREIQKLLERNHLVFVVNHVCLGKALVDELMRGK